MGILGIVFLLLVLIGFGIFIYLIVKTAHGWGALQTTTLFFLLFSTLVYLYSAAIIAKRRVGWVRVHDKMQKTLEDLQKEETKLKYGDLTSTAQDNDALIPALAHLTRLISDRGRVWKNTTLQNFDANTDEYLIRLPNRAGQDPAAAPAAPANNEKLLDEQLVVYAFAEAQNASGVFVPSFYLGEFIVDKASGLDAKLKPTAPLLPMQKAQITSGGATRWSIFELMPLDAHEVFAAEGSQSSESGYFGRMDETQIRQTLGIAENASPQAEAMLAPYLKDGTEAAQNLDPEYLWILVEFTKEYSIDVDSKEKRVATEGGFFDSIGRTVDERLKRGAEQVEVKFTPGDQRLLWKGAADDLIAKDIAKPVRRVYVRPLNNYANSFRDLRQTILTTIQRIDYFKRENGIVQETNQIGLDQIASLQAISQKLEADLGQVKKEAEVAHSEVDRLEQELGSLKSKLVASFQRIQDMHSQILAQTGIKVPASPAP
ncbi:MAG: hypothetical protein U0905_08980 [Pirellulales bacterium]